MWLWSIHDFFRLDEQIPNFKGKLELVLLRLLKGVFEGIEFIHRLGKCPYLSGCAVGCTFQDS